jgi:DNA-directed RNA polymerase subunit E'/Rpb7
MNFKKKKKDNFLYIKYIMESIAKQTKPKYKPQETKGVYSPCQITKNIMLPITAIGKNLLQTLENTITKMVGGKCIVEGYVKPETIRVITFSSGIVKGENIIFDVVFNCEVCFPVSGMKLNCIAKNITKAGIKAESADEQPSPYILFVARDHYYSNEYFNSIEENEKFVARIIAQRFELNDKYISIIAELVPPLKELRQNIKPTLVFED